MSEIRNYEADVAIVGAGMAGGTIAFKLSALGLRVLMIDAGPRIDRVDAVNRFRASPTKGNNSPYPTNPLAPDPDDQDPTSFYVQTGGTPFGALYMKVVGGTTWHMTAHAERFQINDFQMGTVYGGVAPNWPISYRDLVPDYEEAEKMWGVSGEPGVTIAPEPHRYPMGPIPPTYLDQQVAKAAAKIDLKVGPYPHGRNSTYYDNRPPCCGNSNCNAVCPVGAKYDASVHVEKALFQGAQLLDQAVVDKIIVGADGKIDKLTYKRAIPGGATGEIKAKVYVVAAHAIETPLLLLKSAGEYARDGVANSSGLVGRNLMCTMDLTSYGIGPTAVYPWRGPVSATSGLWNFRDDKTRSEIAAFATFILNGYTDPRLGTIDIAQNLITPPGGAQTLIGKSLSGAVADTAKRAVAINSAVEVLPSPANTVKPSTTKFDALGQPSPEVNFNIDTYTQNGIAEAQGVHKGMLTAMGVQKPTIGAAAVGGAIIAGTAVMGTDKAKSVVDIHGRSWDHANLFVVGNGNFVTVSIASPSLTTTALALRAARAIQADLT